MVYKRILALVTVILLVVAIVLVRKKSKQIPSNSTTQEIKR